MAESSSCGEESSEEEHDEVSPSFHRSASPTAAASKKPGFFSERGYLKTLSRQERRRIKREIRKGRKAGEMMNLDLDLYILKGKRGGGGGGGDTIHSACTSPAIGVNILTHQTFKLDPLTAPKIWP